MAKIQRRMASNVKVGGGYSSDTQQVAPLACFNATILSKANVQSFLQLDNSVSYQELKNKLGVAVNLGGKFAKFSVEAKVDFFEAVEDKDYSISLNYYQYATNNVDIDFGTPILNKLGRSVYNQGKNKYFSILCGDHFITSYQQGAMLMLALNIYFKNHNFKQQFTARFGGSFLAIAEASVEVQNFVEKNKIYGEVTLNAFQMGGEPSQLSHVLRKNQSGDYYIMSCSLTAMDACNAAASGLLNYAREEFSTQFSFEENRGITPLGLRFTQVTPVAYLGFELADSLVDEKVKGIRDRLFDKLKENQYYRQKLYPFINDGYPGGIDATFKADASKLYVQTIENEGVLMQVPGGALDCLNDPEHCETIETNINSKLKHFSSSDFKFLDAIMYVYTTEGGLFYNSGDGLSWHAEPLSGNNVLKLKKVNSLSVFRKFHYSYNTDVVGPPNSTIYVFNYEGYTNTTTYKKQDTTTYTGKLCKKPTNGSETCVEDHIETRQISSFYFEFIAENSMHKQFNCHHDEL